MTTDSNRGTGAHSRAGSTFTGKARRRETSRRVKVMEVVSRVFVTIGGLGTIVAVTLIFAFLFAVAVPLFKRADVSAAEIQNVPAAGITALGIDRYEVVKWIADREGLVRSVRVADGTPVTEISLVRDDAGPPRSQSFAPGQARAVFGYSDGAVVLVDIGFSEEFFTDETLPGFESLKIGDTIAHEGGVVQRTPIRQLRKNSLTWTPSEPDFPNGDVPILLVDAVISSNSPSYASLGADGSLTLTRVRVRRSMLGAETRIPSRVELPFAQPDGAGLPLHLFLNGRGTDVMLLWEDGWYQRYRETPDGPALVEERDLLSQDGARVTAAVQLLGEETIAIADDTGTVRTWFLAPSADDPNRLEIASPGQMPTLGGRYVTSLAPSSASRLLIGGTNDGHIEVYHGTTLGLVGESKSGLDGPITAIEISSEEKTILASAGDRYARLEMDPRHPEASLSSLFAPIWYEGYPGAENVWQSTSGTDEFEAKLGLMPLVFGTLKATFYSMIFGAPLALLAALFTSEFLSSRLRARVKIVMELMASLPSVVLGFLGGLVIAPFVQDRLSGVLGVLFALPVCFLLGAHLFQLVPRRLAVPWSTSWQRFAMIALSIPFAIALGTVIGPFFERIFFGGDTLTWLASESPEGAASGWAFILLPLAFVAIAFLVQRFVNPVIRDRFGKEEHGSLARVHFVKFAVAAAAAFGLAFAMGHGLAAVGSDPRGGIVDNYVQRNALVVGFVMGFAIIPIIYTLAEDALSSVPQHLRQASLAAGATPWQTAMRVIVPTAMSGLFSAVMVGLGRAVGETMIVLMATGSTPIMEINIFNGFRTLSANIATELPEAVKDSTHYRVLFLAALTLFAMTFVLNTLAEVIRQRFRKRAFQL